MKRLYFYGVATSYVFESIETANRAGIEIAGFIHNRPELECSNDLEPLYTVPGLDKCDRSLPVIFPLITPGFRKIACSEAQKNGFLIHGILIDPTSVIAGSTSYRDGFQVNAGCVVGAKSRFGIHVLINRSVSLGHDVVVDDFVTFGPGCVVAGQCRIGKGTFIGAGATLLPGIAIGENCIVGAGSVVTSDVENNTVVAGNPAKVIRSGIAGYQDASV